MKHRIQVICLKLDIPNGELWIPTQAVKPVYKFQLILYQLYLTWHLYYSEKQSFNYLVKVPRKKTALDFGFLKIYFKGFYTKCYMFV